MRLGLTAVARTRFQARLKHSLCADPSCERPVFPTFAGSPSRLSVGEPPEVTHDPYEFLQSPEAAASAKS